MKKNIKKLLEIYKIIRIKHSFLIGKVIHKIHMKNIIEEPIGVTEIDNHINDEEFSLTVMKIFDNWVEQGIVLNK